MSRALVLCDLDRTITTDMSFIPMVAEQAREGLLETSASTQIHALDRQHRDGTIGFEDYVGKILVAYAIGVQGVQEDELAESTTTYFHENVEFRPYALHTLELLRPTHNLAIVTSNTQYSGAAAARLLGIDLISSTVLETKDGFLTGAIKKMQATRREKKAGVERLLVLHPFEGSMAFGDSPGDIAILGAVETPFCIEPTDELRQLAIAEGWHIVDTAEELNAPKPLKAVQFALNAFKKRRSQQEQEYFQSQYSTEANLRARFRMYSLEICEDEERYPFSPEQEIIKALKHMGVAPNAAILDMGTFDGQFPRLLEISGFLKPIGVDPNADEFFRKLKKPRPNRSEPSTRSLRDLVRELFPDIEDKMVNQILQDERFAPVTYQKRLINANANRVPVRPDSIDVYMANNMLYHLKDIDGAIHEAKSTLKPTGIFIASTSGKNNKLEHRDDEAFINALIELKTESASIAPDKMNEGFTTEKAQKILPNHFKYVYMLNHEGDDKNLLVQDDESKDIYRKSLYSMYDQYYPVPDWDTFAEAVEAVIDAIGPEGKLIRVSRSVFICSDVELDLDQNYERVYARRHKSILRA